MSPNIDEEVNRKQLLDDIYGAQSLPEIRRVQRAVSIWMQKHPQDFEILATAEQLEMMRLILQEE